MRFIGLLMVAGVIGFSHSAEGQEQDLGGGQGVIWVEGGVDSEVPENAIRVRVGDGWPLCRGTLAEDRGQGNFWRDIGVVKPRDGKCHTLRAKEELRLQENFYYLVPAETDGEVSMGDMVLEADVEARIAEATAQLEADLQAMHDQTQGMVSEAAFQALMDDLTESKILQGQAEQDGRRLSLLLAQKVARTVEAVPSCVTPLFVTNNTKSYNMFLSCVDALFVNLWETTLSEDDLDRSGKPEGYKSLPSKRDVAEEIIVEITDQMQR